MAVTHWAEISQALYLAWYKLTLSEYYTNLVPCMPRHSTKIASLSFPPKTKQVGYYQKVSLQIPPPCPVFSGKEGGGYLEQNFLLGISLLKNFPALRAGGKKGGGIWKGGGYLGGGGIWSDTFWSCKMCVWNLNAPQQAKKDWNITVRNLQHHRR